MHFLPIESPGLEDLERELGRYPRLSGYYITGMVSVPRVPGDASAEDAFFDQLFQYFDDQEWAPQSERPQDQMWADYECSAEAARRHVVESLIGGGEIGHTRATVPEATATDLWNLFAALFPEPRRYFIGMGLGDNRYVYQQGAVIVGTGAAGILWIVEDD